MDIAKMPISSDTGSVEEPEITERTIEENETSESNIGASSNVLLELQCQLDSSLGFTKIEFLQSGVDFIIEGESSIGNSRLCASLQQSLRKVLVQLDVENNCAFITLLNDQSLSTHEVNGVCDLLESQKIFNHHSSCYVVSVPTVGDHNEDIYEGGAVFLAEGQTPEDQVLIILKRLAYMKDELHSVLASKIKPSEDEGAISESAASSIEIRSNVSGDNNRDAGVSLMKVAVPDGFISIPNEETGIGRKRNIDGILIIDDAKNSVRGNCEEEDNSGRAKIRKVVVDEQPLSITPKDSAMLALTEMDSTIPTAAVATGLDPVSSDDTIFRHMRSGVGASWTGNRRGCETLDCLFRIHGEEVVLAELIQPIILSLDTLRNWSAQLLSHTSLNRNGWTCNLQETPEKVLPSEQFVLRLFRIDMQDGIPVVSHAIQVVSSGHVKISIGVAPCTKKFSAASYIVKNVDQLVSLVEHLQSYTSCGGISDHPNIHDLPACENIDGIWFSKLCKLLVVPVNTVGSKSICHECKLVECSGKAFMTLSAIFGRV